MAKINKVVIQWELVFLFQEIKDKLSLYDLIEVSILSKLLRDKFKPLIFTCIEINEQKLSNRCNYFIDKDGNLPVINSSVIDRFLGTSKVFNSEIEFKAAKINPFTNSIKIEFNSYCQYSKEIILINIGKPCFYIFPLISLFINLTKLKLVECTVSIKDFNICISELKNIEVLELVKAEFIETTEKDTIVKSIKLPVNIKELSWFDNILTSPFDQSLAYEFLSKRISISSVKFDPPAIHYQELKKLKPPFNVKHPLFLIPFLQINPQLTSISVPYDNINVSLIKYLSTNPTITELCLDFQNIKRFRPMNFNPNLPYIKTLYLLNFNVNHYDSVCSFIKSCIDLDEAKVIHKAL
ncbi:hypothetical protein CONCODRAFT_11099 [Conidiobolus coronatus NRRL 28638]|uniref:F-box domain-containing protein n=1 Tax=Conidiobolus coronatus (strain ATCC 28846 / CBS 209.66 / NRRL 28638) TaxID=796925 RepID=A0A137NW78_CONC2|nr:hypothetical protein CONCODRAFT_11099 [Conidiobolus coronatus NRRL 28638]|eukprot:KXN66931.1 hypothetical protein CONCODRAFT_11099 [Conidiobolus coronatus NRRL 28638]